ncbi:MAG: AAA family ATPase [Bacteroidetes bacterium]|nr:AAA family ATPase [Bacteroidota bacterium]
MHDLEIYIQARYPLVYLVSWEEDRVLRQLDQIAVNLRKMLFVWTQTQGLYNQVLPGELDDSKCDPEVVLQHIATSPDNAIFVLFDFHAFVDSIRVRRLLRDLAKSLRKSNKTVILVSPTVNIPLELSKDIAIIDFDLPTITELSTSLGNALKVFEKRRDIKVALTPYVTEKLLKAAQGLTLVEFENVLSKSVVHRKAIDEMTIYEVLEEKKQVIRKSGTLEYFSPDENFDQVGGLEHLKLWLTKRAEAFSDRAAEFGLPSPKGLLLVGTQGCGKSLTAKAVAAHWNLPLLKLDVGSVFSGIVGSSEANIRHAIKTAESISPCILWIDEIEKGFSGTASSNFSDGGTAARVFGTFTTWLQEKRKPVFVIATSNDITILPPEVLRKGRFDEIFFVDLPEQVEREDIFTIHLKKRRRPTEPYDVVKLATAAEGFSGAEIEQAIISGMYDAFEESRELTTNDILNALKNSVPLSKVMAEQVSALRMWADKRARRASGQRSTIPGISLDRFSRN